VLYYNGDWAPNLVPPKRVDPSLGKGYDYDVCNAEVLLTRLAVKGGRIVLPDGMSYRLLVLPERDFMPVEVLAKVRNLIGAGATVVGPKPVRDPGLKDYPKSDEAVKRLAAELWSEVDGKTTTQHPFGKGRIIWGKPLREILLADGVQPDFEVVGGENDTFIDFIHRTVDGVEVYFVVNRNPRPETASCAFRVSGRQPELWDPVSGAMRDAASFKQTGGRTVVPLEFEPHGSLFAVFRRPIAGDAAGKAATNFPKFKPLQEIAGEWTVRFDPKWGGPAQATFAALEDWTKRAEDGIKYYSGAAVYRKTFDWSRLPGQGKFFLDLGSVKETARVKLNGKDLGVVWCHPWGLAVSSALKKGKNELEIEVVNLWPNRLIGDGQAPPEKRLTRTNVPHYHGLDPKTSLRPSGLLGPVRIMTEE